MIDSGVDGIGHRLVGLLHRLYVVLLADNDDLADVAILLHLQNDADIDHVIEELLLDSGEFLREQRARF